jgi:hypothetical protein
MIRFFWIIPAVGLLTPQLCQAASNGDNAVEQRPVQQIPMPDESINKQILQTLTDIRDSQLSVLQAQLEILSMLRAQGKAPVGGPSHEVAPASSHRTVAKGHKPKSIGTLSAAR